MVSNSSGERRRGQETVSSPMDPDLIRSLLVARKALVDAHQQALSDLDRRIFAALETPVSPPPPMIVAPAAPAPPAQQVVSTPPEPEPPEELSFRTKGDYLVWYVANHDGLIDFYETSRWLYGTDSEKNRMRVTRLLYSLQERMRLKRIDPVRPLFKVIE